MKREISKYLNIYVVTGFIGIFSLLYIFSFAFVLSDVSSGSSREMKKAYCEENPDECNVSIKKSQ
ncbi:MAG: hypothetical protein JXQ67_04210 [Campylobacterales bacterium]|nr:hypothetical protein [Campylobacterales bacterium]